MIADKGCWERGCACYDSRDGEEGVVVMRKEWVGLTDEEIVEALLTDPIGGAALMSLMRDEVMVTQIRKAVNRIARTIETKLKEKNT